jgi:hypothetical protein
MDDYLKRMLFLAGVDVVDTARVESPQPQVLSEKFSPNWKKFEKKPSKNKKSGNPFASGKFVKNKASKKKESVNEDENNPLSHYKYKHVQGLYHFKHYQHPDGSFIQSKVNNPNELLHQDAAGNRTKFTNVKELKDHLYNIAGK